MIDLTDKLIALFQPEKGKIGRYSASQIYPILNGWITPEEYLNGEKIDFNSAIKMWNGRWKHQQIQELLTDDWQCEVKIEKQYYDWVLIAKADCLNDKEIIEIKTSNKLIENSKKWHNFQLKLYLSMFEKEKGRIVQPIFTKSKLYLKTIGEEERDDEWFKKQIEKINKFHKAIKRYYSQDN